MAAVPDGTGLKGCPKRNNLGTGPKLLLTVFDQADFVYIFKRSDWGDPS